MKLGETWHKSTTYRRLKDKGSVTFHIANSEVRKEVTFFGEDKKPIKEGDPLFDTRMEKYKELLQSRYLLKKAGKDKNDPEYKALDDEIYKVGPAIKFYIEILNRGTEEREILEMTPGAANKLNDLFNKGFTEATHDYILENTGKVGGERYTVSSAPVKKPFTDKEMQAINGELGSDPVNPQEVDPDDIPF